MSRRLNVLASHIAAAEPLDSQPGQQFSGDRGDGFVFTHPEAQHILTNEQRLAYEADGFITGGTLCFTKSVGVSSMAAFCEPPPDRVCTQGGVWTTSLNLT